jgi:hypothetical protein
MSDRQVNESDLSAEFRALGKNLAGLVRSAWESPERRRFQQELETGIRELGITLKQEIDTFQESPTGQRLRTEMEDVQGRIRTGEVQSQARSELFSALKKVNEELEKAASHLGGQGRGPQRGAEEPGFEGRQDVDQEVHPDDVDSTSPEMPHQEIHPDDVDAPPPPES